MKLAVSGCPRNCAESTVKDVGVIATEGGEWEVSVGGAAGAHVRKTDILCRLKTKEEALRVIGRFLIYYRDNAKWLERTYDFVPRLGVEKLREIIVEDSLGIGPQLDAEVEKTLLQLTLAVGKQLARRELRIDPAQVIAIIRESLQELPTAAREIRVHLHPEDAAIVRERLTAPSNERAWTIVEDPAMSRGGCVVKTETSRIDARLESRINTVIANALGDERSPDRTDTPPPDAAA